MAHILKTQLSAENLTALDTLKNSVNFASNITRLGANGYDNLSKYEVSKWKTWDRTQRSTFKSCFASEDIDKAVIGYFLTFPANTGRLDTMKTWQNATAAGTIVAYSLTDNSSIYVDGATITVNRGQGIEFSLTDIHSVSTSTTQSNWVCLMLMK